MKRFVGLMTLLIAALTVTPTAADFYVIAGGGRLGTAITSVPVSITSPGLYYLTKNLTHSYTSANAITVHADDVTIDLNGFCLTGPGKGSGVGNNGIVVPAGRTNVEIRNGSIKAFGGDGMQSDWDCTGIRVVGLRVREVGKSGITLGGYDHLVMDCTVRSTDGNGIHVGSNSLVKGCQVALCPSGSGIVIGIASAAVGNTVRGGQRCVYVIGDGASVTDNTVSGSSWVGVEVGSKCTITRNTASNNSNAAGIHTLTYCTITNNTTDGLLAGTDCTLADNCLTPH